MQVRLCELHAFSAYISLCRILPKRVNKLPTWLSFPLSTKATSSASIGRRVGLVTFVGGLGGGLVFPILPALGLQLGIAGAMIGLILSANRITRMFFDTIAGHLVDRLGGKKPIALGLFTECIGILGYSAGIHFGHAAWWFLGGRALFGVGSALLLVGAQATVLGLSNVNDRGRRVATVRIATSMGIPGGLVLGGVIADRVSDNAAFLVGAGLTFIGAIIALRLIPSTRPQHEQSSDNSIRTGWSRLSSLLSLPEFPFLAVAWGFNMLVFLSVQGVLLATLVVFVQQRNFHVLGFAYQGTAGMVMASTMICSSVMALFLGRKLDLLTLRSSLVLPALAVLSMGFIVLALAPSLWMTFLGAMLVGASFNGISVPMLALLGDVTRPEYYGRGVGVYQLFGDVGGSLGPIVGLEAGLHFGMLPTYLGVGALLILSIPVALWAHRRERRWRIH